MSARGQQFWGSSSWGRKGDRVLSSAAAQQGRHGALSTPPLSPCTSDSHSRLLHGSPPVTLPGAAGVRFPEAALSPAHTFCSAPSPLAPSTDLSPDIHLASCAAHNVHSASRACSCPWSPTHPSLPSPRHGGCPVAALRRLSAVSLLGHMVCPRPSGVQLGFGGERSSEEGSPRGNSTWKRDGSQEVAGTQDGGL